MVRIVKATSVALISLGLLAGCGYNSSNGSGAMSQEQMNKGPNRAAKNAIYSAKVKNARVKRAGNDNSAIEKLIKSAEMYAAKGENDKAVASANEARDKALAILNK